MLSATVTSTVTGPVGPLLWTVASTVTSKLVPTVPVAGAVTVTVATLTSALETTGTVSGAAVWPLSFTGVLSVTWSWSAAMLAVAEKSWLEFWLQVTLHTTGTFLFADTARDG